LVDLWRVEDALVGGKEAAFNFQEALGGFRAGVVGRVGSSIFFNIFVVGWYVGGGVCGLGIVFDVGRAEIFGRM
jgi:hypothetical protein